MANGSRPRPRNQRSKPFDDPGPDTGERHKPVRVTITVDYHEANPRPRRRGDQLFPREEKHLYRGYRYAVTADVLARGGEEQLVTEVAQQWFRDLRTEEWPEMVRIAQGNLKYKARPRA